jgi:Ni/Fe-hydrogenase 1 B-type cytochrome subunit
VSEHAFYREEHPLVFVFTHYINLIGMCFLTLTGFYIHYPLFDGWMGVARGTHIFWAFVITINLIVRVVLAFIVKDANMMGTRDVDTDVKNWLPQPANRHQFWPTLKFYLFFKKEHPISAKYGVLQKIAYLATVPLTLCAAYTGFALWGVTYQMPFFAAGTAWIGGLMNMRILHYYLMWAILCFTGIHAYLASIYGTPPLKIMFLWKETVPEGH